MTQLIDDLLTAEERHVSGEVQSEAVAKGTTRAEGETPIARTLAKKTLSIHDIEMATCGLEIIEGPLHRAPGGH